MKKFLLSSIIMLGVCGIASAQTDSKAAKQKQAGAAAAAAPSISPATPQKAAYATTSDDVTIPATDKDGTTTRSATQTAQKTQATAVNTAGVAVPSEDAKKREAKMAAAKAANAPKGKQN